MEPTEPQAIGAYAQADSDIVYDTILHPGEPETASINVAHQILDAVNRVAHMLLKEYELEELYEYVTLNNNEIPIRRQGRRFSLIFVPTAVANCVLSTMGISYTFNLPVGWTILNMQDGTTIKAPSGTSQIAIIKYTNWIQGSVI